VSSDAQPVPGDRGGRQPEPLYDMVIERFGALGLPEWEERVEGLARDLCERRLERQFETMCPLDECRVTLRRAT
jgi:hypothetical protein